MKKIVLFFLFFSLMSFKAFAQKNEQQNNKLFFDAKNATLQFNEISKKLSNPFIDLTSLTHYVEKLEHFQDQAEICVSKSEAELKKLNELLKSMQLEPALLEQQSEYKFLQEKKLFYAKHLSECRFYIYRSRESLIGYKDMIQKLSAYKILKHDTPIWKISGKEAYFSLKKIDLHIMYELSGIENISFLQTVSWAIVIAFGTIIAIYLRSLSRRWIDKNPTKYSGTLALIAVFAYFVIPITFFGITSILLSVLFAKMSGFQTLEALSHSFVLFFILLALSKYLFYPPYNTQSLLGLPLAIGKSFHQRISIVLVWLLLGALSIILFDRQPLSMELTEFAQTFYITVFAGLLAWVSWLFYKIPITKIAHHIIFSLTKIFLPLLLLLTTLMEWLGFHQLVMFILTAISLTAGLLLLAVGAWKLINNLYNLLDNNNYQTARKLRFLLGVKPYRKLKEIFLIKHICYLVVLSVTTIFLMRIWGMSLNTIDSVIDNIVNGFVVAELKIVPLRIVFAFVLFCFTLLIGRFLATFVARKERFEGEEDTQVAVASIIVYLTFTAGLLLFFLVIGINFTGLAIIAGALSVGVGLGLQNIVNNFVSGIILLLEKPIKPGDRVIVGNTEGFVKKIRLRSTQIATLAREDVIVPNADLIANQVTNYMFRDRYWRVVCQVGVAYGSPINLVKEVLLEVGAQHPDVLQSPPNQPMVLFRNFGDSSLIFELWCVIYDVNKKFIIVSELNFAIDDAFKAHKITIAFPQRDVHIKDHTQIQK